MRHSMPHNEQNPIEGEVFEWGLGENEVYSMKDCFNRKKILCGIKKVCTFAAANFSLP